MPRDDLSSYSSAAEPSDALGSLEPLDAAAGDRLRDGGDGFNDGNAGADASSDAGSPSGQTSDADDATPELDAGDGLAPGDGGAELDAGVSTLDAALGP